MLDLTAGPGGCVGNTVPGGVGGNGMGRLFPVLSDGCQDIGAGALSPLATPDTAAMRRGKV